MRGTSTTTDNRPTAYRFVFFQAKKHSIATKYSIAQQRVAWYATCRKKKKKVRALWAEGRDAQLQLGSRHHLPLLASIVVSPSATSRNQSLTVDDDAICGCLGRRDQELFVQRFLEKTQERETRGEQEKNKEEKTQKKHDSIKTREQETKKNEQGWCAQPPLSWGECIVQCLILPQAASIAHHAR